ncbi:unnamed protein product [Linum tenue]|uniref:TIR domain-containing protein n=1 Tax=Linum tenue TaxID=586396 RepID=A0AAV0RGR7_9ROSI|nr:unnamed protein product [Linum tenue]
MRSTVSSSSLLPSHFLHRPHKTALLPLPRRDLLAERNGTFPKTSPRNPLAVSSPVNRIVIAAAAVTPASPQIEEDASSASVPSGADVVRRFYDGINRRDLDSVEGLIAEKCVYEDLIFPNPFVGRKAIMEFFNKFVDSISGDLQFAIDDISADDSLAVGVTWHLEWKGKPFPFSKGCSFYRLEVNNGQRQIIYARDSVEPALKPGEAALGSDLVAAAVSAAGRSASTMTLSKDESSFEELELGSEGKKTRALSLESRGRKCRRRFTISNPAVEAESPRLPPEGLLLVIDGFTLLKFRRRLLRGKWEYDVFVCFRGSDTRNGFTSHLMDALSDKQIKAFIDDKLQKAECIDELISILHRSALSIVIFSENFADSTWCLEEVVAIAQRVEEFGHRVLPVFYKVDPSDITEDSGSYAAAVEQKHGATSSPEDRKRWKNGLKAVANCAGHTSQAIKIDSELVKAIVKDVLEILTDMSPRVKSDILIGMDARVSELFMIHAFRKGLPPIDWTDLLDAAVSYCKGSPLAIKVLGGAFSQIDHVVEDLIDKSLFIRISGEGYEDVEVHGLLREMAWSIVNEEPKLEIRSRLKNCDDIHKLLRVREVKSWKTYLLNIFQGKEMPRSTFEGGRVTECISLDLSETNEMHLEANAFEGMSSLRYLCFFYSREGYGVCKVHVPYLGLDTLPDSLMWLQWDGFPSKSLPSRFSPENLVSLTIRHSTMMQRCWEVQPKLGSVVRLDLSHCINLTEAPDLSRSPSLVYLVLKGCRSLIELPSHVQDLEKLTTLDVSGCTILRRLPAKLNSKFLKYVYLSNCPKITRCPEINSRELKMLDLRETAVKSWPVAIYQVKKGGTLRLCGKHILSFPAISANLKEFRLCHTTIREMDCYDDDHPQGSLPRFVRLELVDNPQLKSLSRNIWKMVSQSLILHYCPSIDSLPEMSHPVTGLTHLSIKGCRKLKSFPTGINNMKSLRTFCFCNTDIKTLPACVEELDQLSSLDLSSNYSLESVPCNIHKLAKLSSLLLTGCRRIQSLPELPLNLLILDVSGCKSLQALPSNVGRLRWKRLYFEDCPQLDTSLPKEVVHNFHHHAVSNLHPQGVLQYSGSEIPEWFPCKSMNQKNDSCVMVQLPPSNCTIKGPVKGIAFGVVCSSNIRNTWMRFHCKCNIDTTVAARWISRGFGMAPSQSDNASIYLSIYTNNKAL